jgi:AcrR family transcriptional regulator
MGCVSYHDLMPRAEFQRARSDETKRLREQAIIDAAVSLGATHGIRSVTLTGIAEAVGMHKSALLRYFETREQIFLIITAQSWREWSEALRAELRPMDPVTPAVTIASLLARSLVERPMFCDLLAQAPLNLERNVSIESVRSFKLATLQEVERIAADLRRIRPGITELEAVDIIATATSVAGALWQMATPSREVARLFREDPRLGHAIVDVEPRLTRILTPLLTPRGETKPPVAPDEGERPG